MEVMLFSLDKLQAATVAVPKKVLLIVLTVDKRRTHGVDDVLGF